MSETENEDELMVFELEVGDKVGLLGSSGRGEVVFVLGERTDVRWEGRHGTSDVQTYEGYGRMALAKLAPDPSHMSGPHPRTAEGWATRAAMDWPSLYSSRSRVLDAMFCTLGSGHHWSQNPRYPRWLVSRVRKMRSSAWDVRDAAALEDAHAEGRFVDGRVRYIGTPPSNFYPLSAGSPLMCVPDDVLPDWLLLATETAALVASFDSGKRRTGNGEMARRALADLRVRFPHMDYPADEFLSGFASWRDGGPPPVFSCWGATDDR